MGGKFKGIHENEEENVTPWIGNNEYAKQQTKAIVHKNEELIPEVALQTLPVAELQQIYQYLKSFPFTNNEECREIVLNTNKWRYEGFLNKLNHLIQIKAEN